MAHLNSLGSLTLSESQANEVWTLLEALCEASVQQRADFIYWATREERSGTEWRFGGIFGMAGKVWLEKGGVRISGLNRQEYSKYPPDLRDKCRAAEEKVTELLKSLNVRIKNELIPASEEFIELEEPTVVRYQANDRTRRLLFDKLLEYFHSHRCYYGESVMQNDNPQIGAAPCMAEIADEIFQFDVTYPED